VAVQRDGHGRRVGRADGAERSEAADPVGDAEADDGLGLLEVRTGDAEELGVGDGGGGTRCEACEVGHDAWVSRAGPAVVRWAGHRAAGPFTLSPAPPIPHPPESLCRAGLAPDGARRRGYPVGVIDAPARHLTLDGTRNVRDVGGYPAGAGRSTRWRTLLRSDELTRLPAQARQTLLDMGIRQVIDLRWPEELHRSPNVFAGSDLADRVRYTPIALLADDPTPHGGLAGMYRHVFDARATQLADVARALLADDGLPAIIGCAAGKDRTGVTIALLLDLAGVDHPTIVDDYALSAGYFAQPALATIEPDDWRHPELVVESMPEYMRDALDHLDAAHGGARALLARQGLSDADLDRLVDRLTEPGG
jgi:protein-tyrosine phosphatase